MGGGLFHQDSESMDDSAGRGRESNFSLGFFSLFFLTGAAAATPDPVVLSVPASFPLCSEAEVFTGAAEVFTGAAGVSEDVGEGDVSPSLFELPLPIFHCIA